MSAADVRLLEALLRNDFLTFAQRVFRELNPGRTFHVGWHHEAIAYPDLKNSLVELARELRPDVILIEDKGNGIGLIQDLKSMEEGFPVIAYDPGALNKESRVRIQSAKIEGGLVFLPPAAPWLEEFLNEVRRFPNGVHDDQIDALSQLLDYKFSRDVGSLIISRFRS